MKIGLTWVVFGVTAVLTALGYAVPAFVDALGRDPAVHDGQVWRLVTPILVNPQGWGQILANGTGLLLWGAIVERTFGRWQWVALYLTGGVVGEVYSYAMDYYQAGSSVAIAGLLGGVAAWLISGVARVPWALRVGAVIVLVRGAWLAVEGDNHGAPLLAGAVLGGVLIWRARDSFPSIEALRDR